MTSASWPSQSLRNLERTGALKHEVASAVEIRRLLDLARGNLTSAALKNNPLEVRYQVALRKAESGGTKVIEVAPSFQGAPESWLDVFDRHRAVPDREKAHADRDKTACQPAAGLG